MKTEKNINQVQRLEKANEEMSKVETPELLQEQTVPTPKKAIVNCEYNVVLRKAADKKAAVVKPVKNGTEVEVLDQENGFYKVSVDGRIGYINQSFCK